MAVMFNKHTLFIGSTTVTDETMFSLIEVEILMGSGSVTNAYWSDVYTDKG